MFNKIMTNEVITKGGTLIFKGATISKIEGLEPKEFPNYDLDDIRIVTLHIENQNMDSFCGFSMTLNTDFNMTTNDGEGVFCISYYTNEFCVNVGTLVEGDVYDINQRNEIQYLDKGFMLKSKLLVKTDYKFIVISGVIKDEEILSCYSLDEIWSYYTKVKS